MERSGVRPRKPFRAQAWSYAERAHLAAYTRASRARSGSLVALEYLLSVILLFLERSRVSLLQVLQVHVVLDTKVVLGLAWPSLRSSIRFELFTLAHLPPSAVLGSREGWQPFCSVRGVAKPWWKGTFLARASAANFLARAREE